MRLDDQERMKQEAKDKKWSKKVKKTFEQELAKLNRINIQAPDYNVQLNYLQKNLRHPWDY